MSHEDEHTDRQTSRRSKSTATLLTALSPGLGYLYIGRFATGMLANGFFIGLLALFVALWSWLEFFPVLPGLVFAAGWLTFVGFVVAEVRAAIDERDETFELRNYNHWTIYSGVLLVGYVLPIAAIAIGAGSLLWTVAPVDSTSMYPNLAPGDSVLVRKNAYDDRSPEAGELVALRFPGSEGYRILRVVASGPTEVRRAANSLEIGERRVRRIPFEAASQSTTASVSGAVPSSAAASGSSDSAPEGGLSGTSGAGLPEGEAPSNSTAGSGELALDDFELMIERNGSAVYLISIRPEATGEPSFETHELAEDELFLLADNRSAPEKTGGEPIRDSRVFGPVKRNAISGKPMYVAWSTSPGSGGIRWDRIGLRLQ